MPNSLVEDLVRVTSSNAGVTTGSADSNPASEALRALTTQIDTLRGLYQTQASQTVENTAAVVQNTRSKTTDALSTAAGVARTAGSVLGGGLTLLPLISGIAKLFGFGSDQAEPPALTRFALPGAISLEGGLTQTGSSPIANVSYGQDSVPRVANPGSGITSISVNVQTIDSRSFLDHSDDIARAVREAMLNSHPLNDVIAEV